MLATLKTFGRTLPAPRTDPFHGLDRRGGRRTDAVPTIGGVWRHGTRSEYLDLRAESGFITIECEDVTAEHPEAAAITRSAEARFLRVLEESAPEEAATWRRDERTLEAVVAIVRGTDYETVQPFAHRPSV